MPSNLAKTGLISAIGIILSLVFADVVNAEKYYKTTAVADGKIFSYHVYCKDEEITNLKMTNGCAALNLDPGVVRSKEAQDALANLTEDGIMIGASLRFVLGDDNKIDFRHQWFGDAAHTENTDQVIETTTYDKSNGNKFVAYKCVDKYCNYNVDELHQALCEDYYSFFSVIIAPKTQADDRHWVRVSEGCSDPVFCYLCQDVAVTPVTTTTTVIPTSATTTTSASTTRPTTQTPSATSTTASPTDKPNSKDGKIKNTGLIVGCILGAILLIGLIIWLIFFYIKKLNKEKKVSEVPY